MRIRQVFFVFAALVGLSGAGLGERIERTMEPFVQMARGPRDLTIGIWFPEPLWGAMSQSGASDVTVTDEDVAFLQKYLRPYNLFCVMAARGDAKGGSTPRTPAWVHKHARLLAPDGRSYRALAEKEMPPELAQALKSFRYAALAQNPALGEYAVFLAFPNVDRSGRLLVDYRLTGSFSLRLGEATLLWQTPVSVPVGVPL